jgi:hypothetical protein
VPHRAGATAPVCIFCGGARAEARVSWPDDPDGGRRDLPGGSCDVLGPVGMVTKIPLVCIKINSLDLNICTCPLLCVATSSDRDYCEKVPGLDSPVLSVPPRLLLPSESLDPVSASPGPTSSPFISPAARNGGRSLGGARGSVHPSGGAIGPVTALEVETGNFAHDVRETRRFSESGSLSRYPHCWLTLENRVQRELSQDRKLSVLCHLNFQFHLSLSYRTHEDFMQQMPLMFGCQIHFVLLISRQGKVRLTKWYTPYQQKQRIKVCIYQQDFSLAARFLFFAGAFSCATWCKRERLNHLLHLIFLGKVIKEVSALVLYRGPKMCNFVDWQGYRVVYKR